MRVYEFAKEIGMTSKDILEALKSVGFDSLKHMSVLPDEARRALEQKIKAAAAPKEKATAAPKVATSQVKQSKPREKAVAPAQEKVAPAQEKKEAPVQVAVPAPARPAAKPAEIPAPQKTPLKKEAPIEGLPVDVIVVDKEMPLFKVAEAMRKPSSEIILTLMQQGIICNRNQLLATSVIADLAARFNFTVILPEKKLENHLQEVRKKNDHAVRRWPIVVVMGHVDHGKTTLLDFVRKTNVAAREKGGITQHLGAYEVNTPHGKIVFLDTPGHEAFSRIRKRGAHATDLAILVVAADDGFKPQTIEAINAAKTAGVPIIVAINKIDKISSQVPIETIKRQLAEHDLLPEDWGGQTVCVPISAKTGKGVDELLEMIVLQSELMELKAAATGPVKAYVLECNIEKGYGPVATVISLQGTLKQGDYFACGLATGKVRLLVDSFGEKIQEAGPSVPVKIVGFDQIAASGDWLETISYDQYLKRRSKKEEVASPTHLSEEAGAEKVTNLILKADTFGSLEAILDAVRGLNKKTKDFHIYKILSSSVGDLVESDIMRAADTDALVLGFHIKVERKASLFAREHNVAVELHNIIYKLMEYLEDEAQKSKRVAAVVTKLGEATVRKVFKIKGQGVIAGSYVVDGKFTRECRVACVRGGEKVGEGKIISLERDRKPVKEVNAGFEFGFISSGFTDWEIDDVVQCFTVSKPSKSDTR